MKSFPRRLFGLFLGMSVAACAGCGGPGSAPAGPIKGMISGAVKVKGRPVVSGEVTFEPTGESAAGKEALTAPITNGNYETGLVEGEYHVKVKALQRGKAARPVDVPTPLQVRGGLASFDIAL